MSILRSLLLLFVLHSALLVSAKRSTSLWKTLNGSAPLVVARGGFSGLFPDSSFAAYSFALSTSVLDVILWCDVQLTQDGAGICFPNLDLANSSSIRSLNQNSRTYTVNGNHMEGWFSVDYTLDYLKNNVYLNQGIYSRTNYFDGSYPILTVEDVASQVKPSGLWLNIQNTEFFMQHNLSMRSFVISVSKRVILNYVSSPEVGFLGSIASRIGTKTKLVFRFLEKDSTEPSTKQTYGSLLSNLTYVKTFASGILVPKDYIWPAKNLYLESPTSVVSDAHNEGLEVFAADFANDAVLSYNYSYDPIAEYLSFIDGGFSVDGVLSDFPITPSEAIDCFSHISDNGTGQAPSLVITHNGASGVYPGCTDVAYQRAVKDGADVIDCSVQMTSDGVLICLGSIDLIESTTVTQSPYSTRSARIPELKKNPGIFTFNLTWKEIQEGLKPAISNPYQEYRLFRYPEHKHAGNFFSLDDFLTFAKNSSLYGVLISIENAAYLAEFQGLSVVNAVLDSLDKSGYSNHTSLKVMIQSTNSSVLKVFKEKTSYEIVYQVDENIRDALNSSIEDIKGFAHSVSITKETIFPTAQAFIIRATDIVNKLHSYKLLVYVSLFTNEFVSQAWDFFADPVVEINTFFSGANINGVITEFPGTAISYRKNKCLNMNPLPYYMTPVQPGGLLQIMAPSYLPPAEAPNPVLTDADVLEPPLPSHSNKTLTPEAGVPAKSPTAAIQAPPNGQPRSAPSFFLSSFVVLLVFLLF